MIPLSQVAHFSLLLPDSNYKKGLIFYSDRGSQYCSRDFREYIKGHGMLSSISPREFKEKWLVIKKIAV